MAGVAVVGCLLCKEGGDGGGLEGGGNVERGEPYALNADPGPYLLPLVVVVVVILLKPCLLSLLLQLVLPPHAVNLGGRGAC